MIRPWIAGLALLLHGAQLCFVWSHRELWAQSSAWIPGLTSTAFASLISLCTSFTLVACTTKLRWRDVGWTPCQLGWAVVVGTSAWLFNQVFQLIDARWNGLFTTTKADLPGAALSACSEEFLFRLVAVGGVASLAITRFQSRHPLRWAGVTSSFLFAISHIPRDIVLGVYQHFERYPLLLAYGGLMVLVYLTTGNLLMTALLHVLGNQPMLIVAGSHTYAITIVVVKLLVPAAVIIGFAWRRSRVANRAVAHDCSDS
jgi:membrane protease YdiL (CAAX protease family)